MRTRACVAKRTFVLFCLAALGLSVFAAGKSTGKKSNKPSRAVYERMYEVQVVKVVDGDTLDVQFLGNVPPECDRQNQRVRLIGVDTPEYYKKVRQPYADEAKEYTGRCLGTNMRLQLDSDTSYKDRYGRLLAYLYAEDGSMLNYDLIQNGYGRYYGKFKFNRQNMASFSEAEGYAKEHRLGLWNLEEAAYRPLRLASCQKAFSSSAWSGSRGRPFSRIFSSI